MKVLAEMCNDISDVIKYESGRTTEIQRHLGADPAASAAQQTTAAAASAAQHAHQTARCTTCPATSAALVQQVSATLDQLEPFRTAGGLVSGNQWQSTGLNHDES